MWFVLALMPALVYVAALVPEWRVLPWRRSTPDDPGAARARRRAKLAALGIGALVAFPVELAVRGLAAWTRVDPKAPETGVLTSILVMVVLFAPLEEASKVGALWPFRTRYLEDGEDGIVLGSGVAAGFACVEAAFYLRGATLVGYEGAFLITRMALAALARIFAGGVWGYALGRARGRGLRADRFFVLAWLAATSLRGLFDHLVFGRGLASLFGAMPLFIGMVFVAYLGLRELAPNALPLSRIRGRLSFLSSLPPPPSLRAMRDALRKAERPVMLRWIVLGALVTMGVIITCVVLTVILARRFGVDFSAVDEGEMTGAIPLALLGLGVLLAFPASGFLVARASGADSVLEAALSTGLAIVGTLVMLGLAAPVAVVFALAFAPIAFGLACAGAWVAIGGGQS
jgi:RsiW-degrading membrane proteinase PrsW (M82 family)